MRALRIARYSLLVSAIASLALFGLGMVTGQFGLMVLAAYAWAIVALCAAVCIVLQVWRLISNKRNKISN